MIKRPVVFTLSIVIFLAILIFAYAVVFRFDRQPGKESSHIKTCEPLLQNIKGYLSVADYQGTIDYANSVLQDPDYSGVESVRLLSFASAAQCYIKTDWPEKAREYLDSASSIIHNRQMIGNDTLFLEGFYYYCNSMIMRYVYDDINYHEAIKYAEAALDTANVRGNIRQSIIFGINYSILNTQVQESYAYEGAEDLFEKALEINDTMQIFRSAQLCAWRAGLLGEDARARQYMEEAIHYLPDGYMDASTVYADYAQTLHDSNMNEEADSYYIKAIDNLPPSVSSSTLSVYMSYARFLSETGNLKKAKDIFLRGLYIADSTNTRWNRKSFYYGMYDLLKKQNDYYDAIQYADFYIKETDSIAEQRQRKDLIELRIKYETAVKEKTIKENEKKIAQQNEKISIIASIVAVCIVICILLSILYIHKRNSYIALFRLYSDILANGVRQDIREDKLRCQKVPEKNDVIFDNIEQLMRDNHIYRESGLTVEKAASMINTNRTYLSAAIKQNTGLSFIYYINSYRIKEAIDILSDPDNDTPMKAIIVDVGFKSPTTFYKLFSEATGKTPQTWRNDVKSSGKSIQ